VLVKFQNDIFVSLDNKEVVILIMLDMSSAFDTVNHESLLSRLELFGVKDMALEWFRTYLSHRRQCVRISSISSPPVQVEQGVPQGSVLGPLLFTTYLAEISSVMSRHQNIKFLAYADDIQLYLTCRPDSLNQAVADLEICIEDVSS
jgi:hypothetical protein